MNDIIFEKKQGGLARPIAGEDHYSGILFYSATKPTGWVTESIRQVTSPEHATTLGIAKDSVNFGVMYYQIAEAFRKNPGIVLYVGIYTAPVAMDFEEIKLMQRFTNGKIRQIAIFLETAFDVDDLALIQGVIESLDAGHMPLSALYTADFTAVADLTTLPDLKALTHEKVSVILGQDGDNDGAALVVSTGKSVACIGAALGVTSLAKVNECIGWLEKFNVAEVELDVPAFANGQLLNACDENLIDAVDAKGYIFLQKYVGDSGTYFNDSYTCTAATSDYAFIENNRTMDKAIRNIRIKLLPQLKGPVEVDAVSGKLPNTTVKYFEDLANQALEQMARKKELSGYLAQVDPDQDVLSSSEVEIVVTNVPIGVSRKMRVKIGFAQKI